MRPLVNNETFGAATVGERGQIVIPAQVRKKLDIRSGDQLIVFGKRDSVLLIPAKDFSRFLDKVGRIASTLKQDNFKTGKR